MCSKFFFRQFLTFTR